MKTFPNELFSIVGNYLTLKEFQIANNAFQMGYTEKEMFEYSILFKKTGKLMKSLELYNMNVKEFYNSIIYSSLNIHNIYDILIEIEENNITNMNKYDYNIEFDLSKNSVIHISNTINIVCVLLRTIEPYVTKEFIINNPYYYIIINITDNLIQYFQTIIQISYKIDKNIEKISTKFKMMMFDSQWYKSNINIFDIYIVYLLHIGVISRNHISDIYMLCGEFPINHFNDCEDSHYNFRNQLLLMFQGTEHIDILHHIINI